MRILTAILLSAVMCSCASNKPINSPNIGTITQPIGKAQTHVEQAKLIVKSLEQTPSVRQLGTELSVIGSQLEEAQREAGKKQAQIDDLAQQASRYNELAVKSENDLRAYKEKVHGSIWTRNKIILALVGLNTLSLAWIFRKPIVGMLSYVLKIWIP